MNDNVESLQSKEEKRYWRLDRFLLYLITGELGYLILLLIAGIVITVLVYFFDFTGKLHLYDTDILWPVLLYILALPLNLFGGFAGLVINIRMNLKGHPGNGHLLNWIYIATTGWLFILALVFLLPDFAGRY
jgi:hypothetical protein